ncbi:recombinase family protein [Arthrobacter gyeryongensis]|uniref:Recombinase family protein n=1 Tax=Arthrobacter gyeryongensis TaxID=1650592 RepID=A0ABP9STF8_9MICC
MAVHRIGYARVSTRDQNLDLQLGALKAAGCDRIFEDTMSGTKASRPGLTNALDALREGDTLIVWKLDRLGRSVKGLLDFAGGLNDRGIGFVSLTDSIDTTTASGRFFFNVMASLAQMERELMVERTQAGLKAAKEQGRVGGRKRVMTDSKIRSARKLLSQGTPPREVAKNLGVSVPTLYRWVPATDTAGFQLRSSDLGCVYGPEPSKAPVILLTGPPRAS